MNTQLQQMTWSSTIWTQWTCTLSSLSYLKWRNKHAHIIPTV